MKKDSYIYVRVEENWKNRLNDLAKKTKDPVTHEPVKAMWLARKYLKQGILSDEKKMNRKKR